MFQITHDPAIDIVKHKGSVNAACKKFKLQELQLGQFKALMFAVSFSIPADAELQTLTLKKLKSKSDATLQNLLVE